MADFVHLHVHSEYSLLDGLATIPLAVKRASELGMPALAITDHGGEITAVVGRETIFGCQFHPEKSGETGLQILKNFEEICR